MSLIPTHTRAYEFDYDTLHILIQSPYIYFIYWQLSTSKQMLIQEHYQTDWRSLTPALRFYEVNEFQNQSDEQPTDQVSELLLPPGESCFFSGLSSGQAYFAILGIRNEQGQFLPLLRSNTIQVPRVDTALSQHLEGSEQPFIYQPTRLLLPQVTPNAHEHFSAYSVYVPKNTYSVETESGGDTD